MHSIINALLSHTRSETSVSEGEISLIKKIKIRKIVTITDTVKVKK